MSFIGIIADDKDYKFIKDEVNRNNARLELIGINKENICNLKNIKFETIVICSKVNKMEKQLGNLDIILKNIQFLIINTDVNSKLKISNNNKIETITFGMNQKATVTASSIKEDEVLICFQRNIENIRGDIIEVQELKMKVEDISNNKVYNLLATATLRKLYE